MLKPGQIVKASAGRDKESFFVVLEVLGRRAARADGKRRKLMKPKSKNVLHLAPTSARAELLGMTDKKLRKLLAEYRGGTFTEEGGS
jgi:ribosomal protein L14E/L6E/L27E